MVLSRSIQTQKRKLVKLTLFNCGWSSKVSKTLVNLSCIYRKRPIISRGLYIFYPISQDHFFVFKEFFSENSVLMYGLYSRAASNQAAYDGARTVIKKNKQFQSSKLLDMRSSAAILEWIISMGSVCSGSSSGEFERII